MAKPTKTTTETSKATKAEIRAARKARRERRLARRKAWEKSVLSYARAIRSGKGGAGSREISAAQLAFLVVGRLGTKAERAEIKAAAPKKVAK